MVADYFNEIDRRNTLLPNDIGTSSGVDLGAIASAAKVTQKLSGFGYTVTTTMIETNDPNALISLVNQYGAVALTVTVSDSTGKNPSHTVVYNGTYMYTYVAPNGYTGAPPTGGAIPMKPAEVMTYINDSQVLYLAPQIPKH
jgi:hypothetical protein